MSLLRHAPSEAELERMYYELAQIGAPSVGRRRRWAYSPRSREQLIVLASEMLRHDARLLSILLQLMLDHWREINPVALRREMAKMAYPQSLCVVLAFAERASSEAELRYFIDYVGAGWPRVDPAERFFVTGSRPGSRMARRELGRNLAAYAKWGFIGTERPIADIGTKRTVGRYDARTRRTILRELANRRGEFRLAEYLDAVDQAISRQQALADLRSSDAVELTGRGRGARWRLRAPR